MQSVPGNLEQNQQEEERETKLVGTRLSQQVLPEHT